MNTDDKPTISAIRDSQICVSYTVRSALTYIAQATGVNSTDQVAENVLHNWLDTVHPDVMAHIKAKQDADKSFRVELKKKLGVAIPFAD